MPLMNALVLAAKLGRGTSSKFSNRPAKSGEVSFNQGSRFCLAAGSFYSIIGEILPKREIRNE